MSVLIGMFLIGAFIGLGTWLVSWSDDKKRELAVHVYFCTQASEAPCAGEATNKQIDAVRVFLASDTRVKDGGITFITKAQALEIQRKRTPELTENLVSNPLPPSFDIVPARGEDTAQIALAVRQAKLPGVEVVRYGEEVSRGILQVARAIQIVSLIAVLILLGASTILIANTIRLSIFARRREIEVMKLVGATNWFVRGPFMLEGLADRARGLTHGRRPAVPDARGRRAADSSEHARGPRRACSRLLDDRDDPHRDRPRHRRDRVRADASPLPPRLTRTLG